MKKLAITPRTIAIVAMLTTVTIWGSNFVFTKIVLLEIPAFSLAFLRNIFSALILIAIVLSRRIRLIDRADIPSFVVMSLGLTINQLCFMKGLQDTTASHSALIMTTSPVITYLLSVFFRIERPSTGRTAGLIISFIGIFMLLESKGLAFDRGMLKGDVLILVASFGFAIFTLVSNRLLKKYNLITLLSICFCFNILSLLPFSWSELESIGWPSISLQSWILLSYMVLFVVVIAYTLYYFALQKLDATLVSCFLYFQPVVAAMMAILVLSEKMTAMFLLSSAIVMTGFIITSRSKKLLVEQLDET